MTVAGLIEKALGRIPDVGDQVNVQSIRFQVEAAHGNTVTAVCVVRPEQKTGKTAEEEPA